jgi:2-haloacid dehalogenase
LKALSINAIEKYKPAAETYLWAAKKLAVKPQEMIMIAAHGWDLAGPANAGLATGFIAVKVNLSILSSLPNYEAKDIYEMVLVLVEIQVILLHHDNKRD